MISELDSSKVADTLSAILSGKDIPHAFLFTGSKGLGKTSTARIIAKIVNCEKKKSQTETCGNICTQCIAITNGTNMDVLEIDGASNRGIDEIRDLREKVRLSPLSATKKVYTIDEVHMLTTEAFNALLKTLEEPPNHVIFILCTTESHKVPATILSRCFHVAFENASENELVHAFKRIVAGEKLKIEDEVLSSIAEISDGGFRDGTKILEELVLKSQGKKITNELFDSLYHISSVHQILDEFILSLNKKDTKASIETIQKMVNLGVDMKYFTEKLLELFQELILIKFEVGEIDKKKKSYADLFTINDIKQLVELFSKAYMETKYAVLPQLPFELAAIEWCIGDSKKMADAAVHQEGPLKKVQIPLTARKVQVQPSDNVKNVLSSDLQNLWQQLIEKIKPLNYSIAGVLRGCTIKSYDNGSLIIETHYKFHKERLEETKSIALIQQAFSEINGKQITVSVLLSN